MELKESTIQPHFPRFTVACALVAGLCFRLFMAWNNHGFKQMDEHWQVFEPAMSLVDGIWFISKEWEIGDRCWVYPWLVSLPLRISVWLGIQNPLHLASIVRSIHGIVSSCAIPLSAWLTWLYCNQPSSINPNHSPSNASVVVTKICAWFVALWPFIVYCGFHAHAEMVGATFILSAAIALFYQRPTLAGCFFGAAFLLKIDVASAGLVCGLWYIGNRRIYDAIKLAAGALPFAFLVGLVDKLTWGIWFQNVRSHAHVNLVEHVGNQWGVSPWYEHLYFVITIGSAPFLLALLILPWRWKKISYELKTTWIVTLGFVAIFSYVEHKEKRFMAPLIYLTPVLGLSTLALSKELFYTYWRTRRKLASTLLVVLGVACVIHLGAEIRNYVLYTAWEERVVALTNAGLVPDSQKMLSFQWPAFFYFPRKIPAVMSKGTKEAIKEDTRGYKVVSIAMDGKHLGWMEENGFVCKPWPKPPRQSNDPVPTAYRCQRD